jgi:hypothetical protein
MRELHVNLEDDLKNNLDLDPYLDLMLDANLHPLTRNIHQLHKDHHD